jgi:hypothetical protein
VNLVASVEAEQYMKSHGGVLYVRSRRHRYCGGTLTLLDATTTAPCDAPDFLPVGTEAMDVRLRCDSAERPQELVIELRGRFRRRLVASWDGHALKP